MRTQFKRVERFERSAVIERVKLDGMEQGARSMESENFGLGIAKCELLLVHLTSGKAAKRIAIAPRAKRKGQQKPSS
jgi:hypothetical protein